MTDRTKYSALAKLDEVAASQQVLRDFLEWLGEQRIDLCSVVSGIAHDRWAPITDGSEKLIASYLGIDLNAVENERRAILRLASELLPRQSAVSEGRD